jgi:hypothetical protein
VQSLAARAAGIVRAPRATMAYLATAPGPPWLDVLALSTLATFLPVATLLLTAVGRTALVDQWERTAIAFGRPVDDALYAQFHAFSTQGVAYAAGLAVVSGPVLTVATTTIIVAALRLTGHRSVAGRAILAVVAHASVILALRQLVAAPLNYVGETLASPTTLVHLMTGVDEASPLARFLSVIDVFVVWWAVVLAIGVASLVKRRVRPVALTFAGVYVAIALLLALAMAVTGGTA